MEDIGGRQLVPGEVLGLGEHALVTLQHLREALFQRLVPLGVVLARLSVNEIVTSAYKSLALFSASSMSSLAIGSKSPTSTAQACSKRANATGSSAAGRSWLAFSCFKRSARQLIIKLITYIER